MAVVGVVAVVVVAGLEVEVEVEAVVDMTVMEGAEVTGGKPSGLPPSPFFFLYLCMLLS